MKVKRALLNILASIISKLSTVVFGIVIPKLYIDYFGSEMNGLLSSIAGIFVYINLLEAGVGGASIQALYAPISKNDWGKINGILSATNKYYKRTGVYFLGCVSVLAFLYPLAAKSNIPYVTVVLIILLSSVTSALTYFFQGKYTVLLSADNRGYKLIQFNAIFYTISSAVKILLILYWFNIIVVQFAFSIISLVQVLSVSSYARKKYPYLNFKVQQDKRAISKKNSVIIHQIASTIFNNTDVLILTFFLGLKVVSVYTIYNMVFSQARSIPTIISDSLTASFGQQYADNRNVFKRLFNFFEVYYIDLVYVVFIIAYLLVIPFLKLYTSNVTDISYIDTWLPLLFLFVNLLSSARWPAVVVINIAGHFRETQWRAFAEMIINIVVSIALVNMIGIYGVLLGTVVALLYRTFDMIIYSSRYLLYRSSFIPIIRLFINTIIGVAIVLIYWSLNIHIENYIQLALIGFMLFVLLGILYFSKSTIIEKQARAVLFDYVRKICGIISQTVRREK